jgi:hypothetical protein
VNPAELIREAKRQVGELTGLKVETVSGFDRNGDGWRVFVEALELQRVPETMDVLGTYEVVLSDDGELQGLHRKRRYHRSAVENGEG